ncbi:hypothetical protein [Pedobacter psychrotolerans]|nr:hypothetical protein [Pedobacter psychrotolerans]
MRKEIMYGYFLVIGDHANQKYKICRPIGYGGRNSPPFFKKRMPERRGG